MILFVRPTKQKMNTWNWYVNIYITYFFYCEVQCNDFLFFCRILQAQKAAKAKALKEKFEKWEPEKQSNNNAISQLDSEHVSLDTTKSLRARFESLKAEQPSEKPRLKVNRFVVSTSNFQIMCKNNKRKTYFHLNHSQNVTNGMLCLNYFYIIWEISE